MDYLDNRTIRVFISSTFRDMQDVRDELMKKTFPVLRRKAAERDVTLTELDLRWGITPEESESGKVVEICLREIENSVPFFIGIIGNRYGWIPSPDDLGESLRERFSQVGGYVERRLSVTEMEMQFGVLERPEDMHAFFFIKEQETDDVDEPEKLAALKTVVRSNGRYPVSTYSSPEDLAGQVEEAFTKLLDELYPEGALSELEKERIGQRAYLNSLCQNYIRTDANFAVIDEWMQDWEKHQLVITGASGLGKSALVANWVKEKLTTRDGLPYRIIYHFVGNGGSVGSHGHVIKALYDEIRDRYRFEAESKEDKTDEKALEGLFNRVAAEGDKPLLIVLDAINQIIDVENSKQLNWLPIPPKNVKILFTTLEDDRTMEVFKNRHYPVFTLQPLTKEQREEMVRGYLSIFSKKLQLYQVEHIVTDSQCENTLVLKTMLDELINFGIFEKLDEKIGTYLGTESVEEFYGILLKGYEADFGEPLVKHILSLIAVSRNGLSEEEILAITRETPLHWSQFFCAIRQHLIVKNGLVSFAHSYIRKAVENRYLQGQEDWENICRTEIVTQLKDTKTHRAMDEVPYQYDKLGDLDGLYEYLLNFEIFDFLFSRSKIELGHYWRRLCCSNQGYSPLDYLLCSSDNKEVYLNNVAYWARWALSDLNTSKILAEEALQIAKKKNNSQALADAYSYIGIIMQDQGDFRKAVEYHEKDLEIEIKLHGNLDRYVANAMDDLGRAWRGQGDYEKAKGYFMEALKVFKSLNDLEHMAIMENNLGSLYGCMGCYEKAIEYLQHAINTNITLFGAFYREVGICYNNLSNIYGLIGKYNLAIEYSLKAIKISKHCFGDNHIDTDFAYNNLSSYYQDADDFDHALYYAILSLNISIALFGEQSHYTATSYNNIGVLYDKMGEHEKGLENVLKALSIRRKVLGEDNVVTAGSYTTVGAFYADARQYREALEMYEKARVILINGKDDDTLADLYDNIGNLYLSLSDINNAIINIKKGLDIRISLFGLNHKKTIQSLNNLGYAYETDDLPTSIQYYHRAFDLQVETYSINTIMARAICDNLRWCYNHLEDYEGSLKYAKMAFEISQSLGDKEPSYTYQVGDCLYSLGRYLEAVPFYKEALKNYSQESDEYFECMCSLANAQRMGKDYDSAEVTYKIIVEVAKRKGVPHLLARAFRIFAYLYLDLGEDSLALAFFDQSYNSCPEDVSSAEVRRIASVLLRRLGQYDKSLSYCNEAYILFQGIHNERGISQCSITQGLTYRQMGRYQQALECFTKALEMRRKVLPPDDPLIQECFDYINNLEQLDKE